ncbi:MAG TPA: SUMF1/EgtB/PvdO family nonheme iron enzyme [Solirubrobacteraceae bacterium]
MSEDALLAALAHARARTLALADGISVADLERVHSPLMSPLVWDLGHIAAFEDLWIVHRHGGEEMLREDLAELYDAFETPRAQRGDLPFLRTGEAREYLAAVRERSVAVTERLGAGDGVVHELVIRHELQHQETMLQTINLARLAGWTSPFGRPEPVREGRGGLELLDVPAATVVLGAGPDGFSYDNERPRHAVDLPAFRIGRTPVTNATWLSFAEGGGYERREWWSEEAWAWKQEYDITHPLNWTGDGREWRIGEYTPIDPDAPVQHVSWFEADAFARAHDARLPTEQEWERAATRDQRTIEGIGYGWEWTASHFTGYPGFVAHPYREYSEVFFDGDHRVLRGGSWATAARVATPTFRNWDHPQRRQIFAGVRLAEDA